MKHVDSIYERYEFPKMLIGADPVKARAASTPPNTVDLTGHLTVNDAYRKTRNMVNDVLVAYALRAAVKCIYAEED